METAPPLLSSLASIPNPTVYDAVCKPSIQKLLSMIVDSSSEIPSPPNALLLEGALRPSTSSLAIMRLLDLAKSETPHSIARGIIPSLSILSHSDKTVREAGMNYLSILHDLSSEGNENKEEAAVVAEIYKTTAAMKNNVLLDGGNQALITILTRVMQESTTPDAVRQVLLERIVLITTFSNITDVTSPLKRKPLEREVLKGADGTLNAAATILQVMESCGEGFFSLNSRWKGVGSTLFHSYLASASTELNSTLATCVFSMLKGVIVKDDSADTNVGISIGFNPMGRRSRSYSIGESNDVPGVDVISPYPNGMSEAIITCLTTSKYHHARNRIIELVITRKSWFEHIYPKLKVVPRRKIAGSLLSQEMERDGDGDGVAKSALLGLPLTSGDVLILLQKCKEDNLSEMTHLLDCIRSKATTFKQHSEIKEVASILFDFLSKLSISVDATKMQEDEEDGALDYTKLCIIQTLLILYEQLDKTEDSNESVAKPHKRRHRSRSRSHSDMGIKNKQEEKLAFHAKLLVSLLGQPVITEDKIMPLTSKRARKETLSLLTSLCTHGSSTVVKSLIPALVNVVDSNAPESTNKSTNEALYVISSAYLKHCHKADLSLGHLLRPFLTCCNDGNMAQDVKLDLCHTLTRALLSVSDENSGVGPVASMVGFYLANSAFMSCITKKEDKGEDNSVAFVVQILREVPAKIQIATSLQLLRYAGSLISKLGESMSNEDQSSFGEYDGNNDGVAWKEIVGMALNGPSTDLPIPTNYTSGQRASLMLLATTLLTSVREGLTTPKARKLVRNSENAEAGVCLGLWKELMHVQTLSMRARSNVMVAADLEDETSKIRPYEKQFWMAAPTAIQECLAILQKLLPVPHFLASVTAILKDDDVYEDGSVRRRALRLLGDRAAEVKPNSPESGLFLETIPDLTDLFAVTQDEQDENAHRLKVVTQQAALIAIERLAQSLCFASGSKDGLSKRKAQVFLPTLKKVCELINHTSKQYEKACKENKSNLLEGQLLSSAALCSAALVTVLKTRCLVFLPPLIPSLVTSLATVNRWQKQPESVDGMDTSESNVSDQDLIETSKLLQRSILRTILAIAEVLPQFLGSYLGSILSVSVLPSKTLRWENDEIVKNLAERLNQTLATKTPARQLVPVIIKTITKCFEKDEMWEEGRAIMEVFDESIRSSSRADLVPVMNNCLNAILLAYSYAGFQEGRFELLTVANKSLLSLVLKISEGQLRPLYARLREWKGEFDGQDEAMAVRRFCFWSMSAALGSELRAIFLPCLSSVITDIVDELEYFVSKLCEKSVKQKGDKKRRRLSGETTDNSFDEKLLRPMQPLLLCLETALKADAHEGGGWVRADEGKRFHLILRPLSKLLLAKIPTDYPTEDGNDASSAFEKIVQGVGTLESGNVVNCITALAAGAGNEQLWKPLNHAILEACGNESRGEVRKAGVTTLLSVLQTIGEEYMVLLPECLPVLSELLEDGDEDVCGLAKECVKLGEDLLGESLDDSLR